MPIFDEPQPSGLHQFVFDDESGQPTVDWDGLFEQDSYRRPSVVSHQAEEGGAFPPQDTQAADDEYSIVAKEVRVQPDDPSLPEATLTVSLLHSLAHLNAQEAADHFGIARDRFKAACHRLGIAHWNSYRLQAVPRDVREARERQSRQAPVQLGDITLVRSLHASPDLSHVTVEQLQSLKHLSIDDLCKRFKATKAHFTENVLKRLGIDQWRAWRYAQQRNPSPRAITQDHSIVITLEKLRPRFGPSVRRKERFSRSE